MLILCSLVILAGCAYRSPNSIASPAVTIHPGDPSEGTSTAVTSPAMFTPTVLSQTAQPTVTNSTPATPSPTPKSIIQVPAQYDLNVTLDYEGHSASVEEAINYVNLSTDSLVDLILVIEPNLSPAGFDLLSMTWANGESVDPYTLDSNLLQIPLPQPLPPGGELRMRLTYDLLLPQLTDISIGYRPVAYGYSSIQTNLADWYAYVPPYRAGEGWLVHAPWVFGEYQVYDVANFDVTLALAQPVPGLVIAAPAPAQQDGDRYIYHLEAARSFALSASTEYEVQTVTRGDITINSYSFPVDKNAGQEALQNTADAVELYSQLIVPYPRKTLSVIEADFMDGMEFDGMYFLSHGFYNLYDGTPKGYLTFIAAHETAHQWWYSLVGNDQALEPWLDEALCTYMEHIFYENIYPEDPSQSGVSLVDWWWYYRVNFYDPTGWVDGAVYNFNDTRSYRDAVYLSGAYFLHDLRKLIGDQAFFASLRDYANTNAYKIATGQDFFASVRRHSSQDLDGILSDYFQSIK